MTSTSPGKAAAATIAAVTACILAFSGCGSGSKADDNTLTIASWGDPFTSSTRKNLAEPFEKETGIKIQIVDAPGKFVSNLESQKQANNVEWDLLDSTSGPDAYIAYDKGLIQKMPDDVKSSLSKTLPKDAVTDFGITWSILGYVNVCNTEAVTKCPATGEELFNSAEFPGKRTSISTSPLVNLSMAELANGVSKDDLATHDIDLDRAFATLEKFNSAGGSWWSSGDQNVQLLENGAADMGISYSGRAFAVKEGGTPLKITWKDGLYNPGFWNVVEGSHAPKNAWKFVEWVGTHPEAAANWGEDLGYSVPDVKSQDYFDKSVVKTLADYPKNKKQLANMNYDWYVENYAEVNDRWQEFLRG